MHDTRSAEDLIPASGKIVVFDYDLPVKYAFYGLLENNIKCAPVWDTTRSAWVGMLTVRRVERVARTRSCAWSFYDSR